MVRPGEAKVHRHELLARLDSSRVCLIEAPGGFGKSTFARELAVSFEIATTIVPVDGVADADTLVGMIVEGLRRAGFTDLADTTARAQPGDAVADLGAALGSRGEPLCLLVDDVQRLTDDGATWLAGLIGSMPAGCRVIVAGRHLPAQLGSLGPDGTLVDAGALRFSLSDISDLLVAVRDEPEPDDANGNVLASEILRTTDGWPVAVDLVVTQRHVRTLDPAAGPRALDDIMAALVDQLLTACHPDERGAIARLGAVPLLSRDVAGALGHERSLEVAETVGLPLGRRPDGWLALSDPVRDALHPPALEPAVARAVADIYCRTGELSAAVHLLHSVGDTTGIAEVIGTRPWTELEAAGVSFARLVAGLIGDDPGGPAVEMLVTLARAVEHDDPILRSTFLTAADGASAGTGDARRRMVAAELANDACRRGDPDGCDVLAAEALGGTARETETRARALFAQGIADTIRATPRALAHAGGSFSESAALAELTGQYRWTANALVRLGYGVSFHGGDIDAAIAPIERALALAPAADRSRAVTLTYLADVLDHAGRITEADAACREALAIGRRLRDQRVIGYACWSSAWLAAHLGDHAATIGWLAEATHRHAPWLDQANGAEFYLAAADMLFSLGDEATGSEYLEIGRQRTEFFDIPDAFAPAWARYEAMFGDPERAEALLAELDGRPFSVMLGRWSTALQRAFAAHRRGDSQRARMFRAEALAEAAKCGYGDLPARHERWLDERLRQYDSVAHVAEPAPSTAELRLLGAFSLHAGGAECTPPHGHPATMLKLLALRGPTTNDELIDAVWPDVDASTARARLRNTLNRLRSRSGDVVVRHGETMALAGDVAVDVDGFEAAADQALDAPGHERAGLARRAAALYRGDLLPGDRYADWAAAPRERLRRRYLSLVDLLADDAETRGDLDEAVRQLDAGMAIEPLDERRPVRAARLLLVQGRRASARDVVRRALAVVDELGITVSAELGQLVDEVAADLPA